MIYIKLPLATDTKVADIETSIRGVYESLIRPRKGYQLLRIAPVDAAVAKLIGLDGEQAVMEFSCITHDESGRPIEFSRNLVRNDKADFIVHYTNQ